MDYRLVKFRDVLVKNIYKQFVVHQVKNIFAKEIKY
jgi:hypothetical protein